MVTVSQKDFKIFDLTLPLFYDEDRAFVPNTVTGVFAKAMRSQEDKIRGKIVFGIGMGVAPLEIYAALALGASKVYGVEIVPAAAELAAQNIKLNGLENRVIPYQGSLFDPLKGKKAQMIINDASGLADIISYGSKYYPQEVPTGGPDGADVVTQLLAQAPAYLDKTGYLMFAVTGDLSDSKKIMDAANSSFSKIESILAIDIPMVASQIRDIQAKYAAENRQVPDFFQKLLNDPSKQKGSGVKWHGEIYLASQPK